MTSQEDADEVSQLPGKQAGNSTLEKTIGALRIITQELECSADGHKAMLETEA